MIPIRKSFLLPGLLGCALALLSIPVPARGADDDPFSLEHRAGDADPFSTRFQAKPAAQVAPRGPDHLNGASPQNNSSSPAKKLETVKPTLTGSGGLTNRIQFTARVQPETVRPGGVVKLVITGKLAPDNHTYPMTQRTGQQNESQLSRIMFNEGTVFQPLWPVAETKPTPVKQADGAVWLEHDHDFTWTRDVYVKPTAKPGKHLLGFTISLMVCDEKVCLPYSKYPRLEVPVDVQGEPVAPTKELEKRLQEPPPPTEVVTPPEAQQTFWGFIALSMGAAVLMLMTPCVFPMIPITVSFFLKQSESEHHNALLSAGVYCLTIIVVLTLAVLALGGLIVQLANDPWLNLGLGLVLAFFALSLLGMYEIELPSFLARFTSAREGKGGMAGAFFMALTFTITSFTCTGPFLGPLLVGVKESQLTYDKLIFGALAYSATFAAPFFLLALFPRLLKTLPKSGGWLNAIKVVMGFLEFAAALKFLANTDMALNPGEPMFFTYDSVLCAWIALSIGCGLYLLGIFRLPHDSPVEHISVVRMLFATFFLGFAVYMTPALWRETPQGVFGKGLVAFLPLDTKGDAELTWHREYKEAWAEATKDPARVKPIFIDFTGINCTNCRDNEKNLFPLPKVRDYFKQYVLLQLYTDSVPEKGLSSGEASALGDRNRGFQEETFKDITNPFYAIIIPTPGEEPFVKTADGKLKLNGKVVGTRKGKIPTNMVKDFESFLRDGLR